MSGDYSSYKSLAGHGQRIILGLGMQSKTRSIGLDLLSEAKSDNAGSAGQSGFTLDGQFLLTENLVAEGALSKTSYTGANNNQDIEATRLRLGAT